MSSKSSSLNLYDLETKVNKLDIDVSNASGIVLDSTGGLEITVNPALNLFHASGSISDVASHIKTIEANIAAGSAGSATASAQVQSNLDAYSSSTNTSIGLLQSDLTNEIAQRGAGQTSDANARAALSSTLTDLITGEESARIGADGVLTTNLAAETSSRLSADTLLQQNVDIERGRIDDILSGSSVDLNTLVELVNAYQTADTSILSQITTMQDQITALQATINDLTSSA
jgi:hypothetical protein